MDDVLEQTEVEESVAGTIRCTAWDSLPGDCHVPAKWMICYAAKNIFLAVCSRHLSDWQKYTSDHPNLADYEVYPI
jgi:hypothetical protein